MSANLSDIPIASPAEARKWVSASLFGQRIRAAEILQAENRGTFYLVGPRASPMSGWKRPAWLGRSRGRVYATRTAAERAAKDAEGALLLEYAKRGWPIADLIDGPNKDLRPDVLQPERLPSWIEEVEMTDGEVVRVRVFISLFGCLMWPILVGSILLISLSMWLLSTGAAILVSVVTLLGVLLLMSMDRRQRTKDAEARTICLCGLPRDLDS